MENYSYKVFALWSQDPALNGLPVGVVMRYIVWSQARFAGMRHSPQATSTWFEHLTGNPGDGWVYAEWLDRFAKITAGTRAFDQAFWRECDTLSANGGMFVCEEGEVPADNKTSMHQALDAVYERTVAAVPAIRTADYEANWRGYLLALEAPLDFETEVDIEFSNGQVAELDFLYEGERPIGGRVFPPRQPTRHDLAAIRDSLQLCQKQGLLDRATSIVLFDNDVHTISEDVRRGVEPYARLVDRAKPLSFYELSQITG